MGLKGRFILIILFFLSCEKPVKEAVKIGYQPYWAGPANIAVAMKNLKLLEKKGYNPSYIPFLAGPPINHAIASGKIDVGFTGDMPTISALASGMKIKIIGACSKSLRQALVIDMEKADKIKTISDLKGRKIAVTKGSASHYFLYKLLKQHGIGLDAITLIHMDIKEMPFALKSDEIDASAMWEPWPTKVEKEGIARVMVEGKVSGYVYARDDFLRRHPTFLKDFKEALQFAVQFAGENLEETSRQVAEETGENFEVIYLSAKTDRIFQKGENIEIEEELIKELKEEAEFLFEEGLIHHIPDFESALAK